MAAFSPGALLLRNPITGIAGCCARAARGSATDCAAEKRDEIAPLHLPPRLHLVQGLNASTLRPRCPLWVKSRHFAAQSSRQQADIRFSIFTQPYRPIFRFLRLAPSPTHPRKSLEPWHAEHLRRLLLLRSHLEVQESLETQRTLSEQAHRRAI